MTDISTTETLKMKTKFPEIPTSIFREAGNFKTGNGKFQNEKRKISKREISKPQISRKIFRPDFPGGNTNLEPRPGQHVLIQYNYTRAARTLYCFDC